MRGILVRHVVLINNLSVARGGATGLALLEARLLRAMGLPVTFVTGDDGQNSELATLGCRIVPIGSRAIDSKRPLAALGRGIHNAAAAATIRDLIEKEDSPDRVYHVHAFSQVLSPSIFDPLGRVRDRTFLHAHDFFLGCPNGGFMDYRAMRPCERVPLGASCILTNCDKRSYAQKLWRVTRQAHLFRLIERSKVWGGVILIHPDMAEPLVRSGYEVARMCVIRNPAAPLSPARIEAEGNASFFFIGRVEAEKGIEDLISAAAIANVPLVVIGDGSLREKLAGEHPGVSFLGWQSKAQIAQVVRHARAVVMPSRYPEPFGLVVAEASASGLPIIISKTAFLGREIEVHGLGMTIDPLDTKGFAEALARYRDMNASDIETLSRRAYARKAGLATTEQEWIEALLAQFRSVTGHADRTPAQDRMPAQETP